MRQGKVNRFTYCTEKIGKVIRPHPTPSPPRRREKKDTILFIALMNKWGG
jgi:hypothetical protein